MASSGAMPYFVPSVDSIEFGDWQILLEEWGPLPRHIEFWDPEVSLRVSQTVVVDLERVLEETRIPRGSRLGVVASWRSSKSTMKGPIAVVGLSGSGPTVIEGDLRGAEISGVLELETSVTLLDSVPGAARGVASTAGSVLSASRVALELEPEGAQFPVAVVDFAHTRIDAEASWHLETSTDLAAAFYGSFQLLINSRDRELVRSVEARKPDPGQEVLLAEFEGAVAQRMFEFAISVRREADEESWAEGSIGDVLSTFIRLADEHGVTEVPSEPTARMAFTSRVAGLARAQGYGRAFT